MRRVTISRWVGLTALLVALALVSSRVGKAQEERLRFGAVDMPTVGLDLTVAPPAQTVPRGVQTTVTTALSGTDVTIPLSALAPLLPQPLTVQGELHGPAFLTPLTLSAPAGSPLTIPTLPIKGRYTLENIRLVGGGANAECSMLNAECRNGEILLAAAPTTVVIEAIGDEGEGVRLFGGSVVRAFAKEALQEIRDRMGGASVRRFGCSGVRLFSGDA